MKLLSGIDALLVSNAYNIQYLTGFVSVAPEAREAYLLILPHHVYLVTNSLYLEQAKLLALSNCYIVTLLKTIKSLEIIEFSKDTPLTQTLKQLCERHTISRLGFEEAYLTVAEFQKLTKKLKGIALIPTKDRIETFRMIKNEDEISNIRAAAKLTDACFAHIVAKLTPGVEERRVAWDIEAFFRRRGAAVAFAPIVAFGKNSSQPHYQGTNGLYPAGPPHAPFQGVALKTLSICDIVLLDFGARVNGYCSDMTRVVFIGKPKDEWKRAYQAVSEAQQRVLDELSHHPHSLARNPSSPPLAIRGGRVGLPSGAKLDQLARDIIRKHGFPPYPHSLGHSLGLAIHESPRLSVRKDVRLKPGMVFTIEPAIYQEGKFGIRIEDLVVLKKDSIEVLSKSPKSLTIIES